MAKLTTLPQLQSNTTRLASFVSSALSTVAGAIEEIDDAKANKSAVQTFQFDSNGATLYGGTGDAIFIIPSSTRGGGTVTKLDPQFKFNVSTLQAFCSNTWTYTWTRLGDGEVTATITEGADDLSVEVDGNTIKLIGGNNMNSIKTYTLVVNVAESDDYKAASYEFNVECEDGHTSPDPDTKN